MERKVEPNYTMIFINESINLYTSEKVKNEIIQLMERESNKNIVINLNKVPYIDSSGLLILNTIQKKSQLSNKLLYLFDLDERIHSALQLAGLKSLLGMIISQEDLLKL